MASVVRRLRQSRVLLIGVLLVAVVGTTTAVVAAVVLTNNGPFTGCLSRFGVVYNAKAGGTPLAGCARGDTQIAFSNAQGLPGLPGEKGEKGDAGSASLAALEGTPCDIPGGPGKVQIRETTAGVVTIICDVQAFAIAFSDVDGVDGYDPASDVWIAKLVDTNGTGIADAGDTVVTNRYPTDFTPTLFGDFSATTHTVATVADVFYPDGMEATDIAGNRFVFVHTIASGYGAFDSYLEDDGGVTTELIDRWEAYAPDARMDSISVQAGSPSLPLAAVVPPLERQSPGGDDGFLDVVFP